MTDRILEKVSVPDLQLLCTDNKLGNREYKLYKLADTMRHTNVELKNSNIPQNKKNWTTREYRVPKNWQYGKYSQFKKPDNTSIHSEKNLSTIVSLKIWMTMSPFEKRLFLLFVFQTCFYSKYSK